MSLDEEGRNWISLCISWPALDFLGMVNGSRILVEGRESGRSQGGTAQVGGEAGVEADSAVDLPRRGARGI